MKNWKLSNWPQPIPPYSVQLCQNARPVFWWKLHGFEFATSVSPHTDTELVGILIAPQNWWRSLKIVGNIIWIRNRQRQRIQSYNGNAWNAQYPLIAATPRVLDDHMPSQVLRLLQSRRSRIAGIFHDGRRRGRHWAVMIGFRASHGFNLVKIRKGVWTRRMISAEKEPRSLRWWSRRRAPMRPRLIRPQFWYFLFYELH